MKLYCDYEVEKIMSKFMKRIIDRGIIEKPKTDPITLERNFREIILEYDQEQTLQELKNQTNARTK